MLKALKTLFPLPSQQPHEVGTVLSLATHEDACGLQRLNGSLRSHRVRQQSRFSGLFS